MARCRDEAPQAKAGYHSPHKNFEATARLAMKFKQNFYYVYILESKKFPRHFYSGFTKHLENRLKAHNNGNCPHTAKFKPWQIKTAVAFTKREKALEFEQYLKSPSGRAFAKKRL